MPWQQTPYLLVLFGAAVTSSVWGGYGWRRRTRSRRRVELDAFVGLCLAVAAWAGVYAVQVATPTLAGKLAAYKLLHVGGVAVPPAWFVFALAYTDNERWVTPSSLVALAVIPAALLLALPTNPASLALGDVTLSTAGGLRTLETENGPMYALYLAYAYVLLLAGSALIARDALDSDRHSVAASALLLTGVAVPFVVNVLEVFAVFPPGGVGINFTPVSLAASAFLFGLAVFRYRLFDRETVARETVVREMREGVVVLDETERVTDANPAAMALLGLDEGIVGRSASDVIPGEEAPPQTAGDGVEIAIEAGGESRYVEVTRTRITGGGESYGWILICRDVTARREYTDEIRRQNERLEQVAAITSHDLRNPLTVARGRLDLARGECDSRHLEPLDDALVRIETIVVETLQLARDGRAVDASQFGSARLAELAPQCWETVDTRGATLEVVTDAAVTADVGRLRSVLENLFRNAVEHGSTRERTPGGAGDAGGRGSGSRQRTAENARDGGDGVSVRVGALPDGDGFYVEDDGPGFPAADRTRVFDLGYSTRAEGTGLGLNIVEDIVDAHGWEIRLTDAPTGGARIEVAGVDVARGSENDVA